MTMRPRTYSTDASLSCPCESCKGLEVRITGRKFRNLSRLESPAHEQAVHKIVSTSRVCGNAA